MRAVPRRKDKLVNPHAPMLLLYAKRLAEAGYATEAIKLRGLAHERLKPGENPTMTPALFPDMNKEEVVAVDTAVMISSILERATTVDGTHSIATAVFAAVMVLKKFEFVARDSKMPDGQPMPEAMIADWRARAEAAAERLYKMTAVMVGPADDQIEPAIEPDPRAN